MTRRSLVASLAAAASLPSKGKDLEQVQYPAKDHREWKPRLGVLGAYTPANVAFAQKQGFTNMILRAGRGSTLSADKITDAQVADVKRTLEASQMHVSAFQIDGNHIDPNPEKRASQNDYFVKAIELAGKLGVHHIGTQSGKDPSKTLTQQVDEIVRVYHDKYFPACERNQVRILWEPYPESPNIAVSPVGFAALFKGFGETPWVGLQYDPSHLVRQFMDPVQTAREFVEKIYDVHLKDTEILWPVLRAGGIHPVDRAQWWRYRIPGMGSVPWREFFSVLQDVGYCGGMSIEQEDSLYGADEYEDADFPPAFQEGFIMAKRYLTQFVP